MARSTARKRALNTLYEADEKDQDIVSLLEERIAQPGAQTPLPQYAIDIVRGVAEHEDDIDDALDEHSTKWSLERMAVVDRNILRVAAWEILFNAEVPDRVAIDEALGLAKSLCDDESPAFIHGLLSALSNDKDAALERIAKAEQEREAQRRQEAALHAPTAPGFLTSGGVSGRGDGKPMDWSSDDESQSDSD